MIDVVQRRSPNTGDLASFAANDRRCSRNTCSQENEFRRQVRARGNVKEVPEDLVLFRNVMIEADLELGDLGAVGGATDFPITLKGE